MLKKIIPLVFILLWIVPVGWVGLMRSNYPLYPAWIAPLFRVSGIFEKSSSWWRIFFIEIQYKNTTDWHYIDEKVLFAQTPLGDRTRFQQLMSGIEAPQFIQQAPRLLNWIADHLPQAEYPLSQLKTIRIMYFRIPSETFLKCTSLADEYKIANATNMPRVIVASLNLSSSSHENP